MGSHRVNQTSLPSETSLTPLPHIIIYPTVRPETVIVPIVSSIVLFPAAVLLTICCLRRRAERARRRIKRRRYISFRDRGDMHGRQIPVIRIHGQRRDFPGEKRCRRDERRRARLRELHYSTASVFQAVLGIDLDLDERCDREADVMGYTSLRPASPGSSSLSSLRMFRRSSGPQIIQMEMSPRVPRSARTCRMLTPTPPVSDTYWRPADNGAATFRRPGEHNGTEHQPDPSRPANGTSILRVPERNGTSIPRPKPGGSAVVLLLPEQGAGAAILRCPERNTSDTCRRPAETDAAAEVSVSVQCPGVSDGKVNGLNGSGRAPSVHTANYLGDPGTAG